MVSTKSPARASVRVVVDGLGVEIEAGATALEALRAAGKDVPTACHDPRLKPAASCRLCLVGVEGMPKPQSACSLPVAEGMVLEVETPAMIQVRRAQLALLARRYPRAAYDSAPEKPLHRHFEAYGLLDLLVSSSHARPVDASNPYFRFDPEACIQCFNCVRICEEVQGSNVWQIVERGAQTEVVPDSIGRLAESTCRSCGACVDACPSGALLDHSRVEASPAQDWTRTTCPYCGVGCELSVGVREGRIVQVLPVLDSPVSRGHLCVKGRYAHGFVHADDRVTSPLIRKGGAFHRVSWDEAAAFVAEGFARVLREHGPSSVGVLGSARAPNEDNYMAQKFARIVLGTHNVDCCARVCHAPTAAAMKTMLGTGAATNSFDDLEKARTILVAGANATECHPIVGERILQARKRGAHLIVIDPRRTDLAEVADVHLALRPGTNVPLFHAIAHAILESGWDDRDFLDNRVEEVAAYRTFVQDFAPEAVAETAGVSAEAIREAAWLYAKAKPAMAFHGLGLTEHLQGTQSVMALVNLALLTGNMGQPGSGINPLRGQNNVQGSAHMGCEPSNLAGFVSIADGRARFEAAWNHRLPEAKGLTLMQMMDEAAAGRFKALWAIGYDVLFTNAQAAATRQAMANLDFVVVQDLFLNETAREFAHVFLPACSSFEREGTFMNAERRVQRVRRAIPPVGESKPDWEIVQHVAQAMGFAEGFSFDSAEAIWNEVRQVWLPGAGMRYDRLDAGGLQWPCPSEDHPGTTILHKDTFPIGPRASLQCIPFIPTPETLTAEFPMRLSTGRSLYHFNAGTMTYRTPNRRIRPIDVLDMHPDDADALGFAEGEPVRIVSRYGSAELPLHRDDRLRRGELFATFHAPEVFLNLATSPVRDNVVGAPEYKVCAVRVERANLSA